MDVGERVEADGIVQGDLGAAHVDLKARGVDPVARTTATAGPSTDRVSSDGDTLRAELAGQAAMRVAGVVPHGR